MTQKVGVMWHLALIGGVVTGALVAGWWIRRYQRDIDKYQPREYRAPLVFQWPGWP